MARLTGPTLSIGSSGTIAKTLVTGKIKGTNFARGWVKPKNPKTIPQQTTRAFMQDLIAEFHNSARISADNLGYNILAKFRRLKYPGWPLFVKIYKGHLDADEDVAYIRGLTAVLATTTCTIEGTSSFTSADKIVAICVSKSGTFKGQFSSTAGAEGVIDIEWTSFPGIVGDYIRITTGETDVFGESGFVPVTA